jgi:hypothetical protein
MGLFSAEKRIVASSTVYNLAGDEKTRAKFMPGVLLRYVLDPDKKVGLGERISKSVINGFGMAQRKFFQWAQTNYALGMPTANIGAPVPVDRDVVVSGLLPILGLSSNQWINLISAEVDTAEVSYWAEEWIYQNRPDLAETAWYSDVDFTAQKIRIVTATEAPILLDPPADLLWGLEDQSRKLLYVGYEIHTHDPVSLAVTNSAPQMFTYRIGSGNVVFDNLWTSTEVNVGEFFPPIPLRINNESIRDVGFEDTYAAAKKAFRKLTGKRIDELLDQIEENEQIDDIDYAFMVQGVNLSTEEQIGQQYLYKFFQLMKDAQLTTPETMAAYVANQIQAQADQERGRRHILAHTYENDPNLNPNYVYGAHPLYGQEPPPVPTFVPVAPVNSSFQIKSDLLPDFDIRLEWIYITEQLKLGNGKTWDGDLTRGKLKVGEYWLRAGDPISYRVLVHTEERSLWRDRTHERIYLVHQYDEFRYRQLEIVGLTHINNVYRNHMVRTSSNQAVQALIDGEESGFIIPLHYPTLKEMGMVKTTQLSTVSSYILFNSYEEIEIPWYASGFFRFIIIAASIALVPFSLGGSLATGAGILGANVAVGAAVGASAASAAIVGAVANYLAAIVVSQLIQIGARELIGGKFGEILGALASFVALTYAGHFAKTGNFNVNWGSLMRVENIIKLTNSVSNAYSRWVAMDTVEIYDEIEKTRENYEEELEKIDELRDEVLGMTNGLIDPMMFTDAAEYYGESSEAFLTRTLLTGSDIARLTHAMIENFADISLELPSGT